MADPVDRGHPGDFARVNGWDAEYELYSDHDLPTYVGPTTSGNLPWGTDPSELRRRLVDVAIVGAPFDDGTSHRPGARFGPRAIREAQSASGSLDSLQLDVEPFEVLTVAKAGDSNIVPSGGMLTREVLRAIRRIVGAVELALIDVVEASPPFGHAEVTAAAANRCVLEVISALAAKRRAGGRLRHEPAP
jgi:arginase family enzyme